MNVYNKIIATNQAMNTNFTAAPDELYEMVGFAMQAVVTGTPTGTIKLQSSVDAINIVGGPVNWADITGSSFSLSTSGVTTWNVTGAFYNWVRAVYTDSSGGTSTATVTITFNAKSY